MPEPADEFGSPEWQAEWDRWLRKVASYQPTSRPQDVHRARLFVLVTTFGNFEQYHTDLAFYAKVENCARLLDAIDQASVTGSPGEVKER